MPRNDAINTCSLVSGTLPLFSGKKVGLYLESLSQPTEPRSTDGRLIEAIEEPLGVELFDLYYLRFVPDPEFHEESARFCDTPAETGEFMMVAYSIAKELSAARVDKFIVSFEQNDSEKGVEFATIKIPVC